MLAFDLLQLPAEGLVGGTHAVPLDKQQDRTGRTRQGRQRKQDNRKQHLH